MYKFSVNIFTLYDRSITQANIKNVYNIFHVHVQEEICKTTFDCGKLEKISLTNDVVRAKPRGTEVVKCNARILKWQMCRIQSGREKVADVQGT